MNDIIEYLERLVNIPSPSGYTNNIIEYINKEALSLGFETEKLNKGGLIIKIKGKSDNVIGLSAHVDTLGAMVRSITNQGLLKLTQVGGMTMESIECSYCNIHTRDGKIYSGTILSKSPSVHSYDDANSLKRTERDMEVRLDEVIKTKEDVLNLGISNGDYISFEPYFKYLENGFIKSRHLDDKASVAILMGLMKKLSTVKPPNSLNLIISNYEEVGHGASYIPSYINELLAVDMGVIGDDLDGNEYSVSICAKDSSGPYDYDMTTKLINLAKQNGLDYTVDIFPHYGSDASAALRGGNNIRAALIGTGVHASHGMERTHLKGIENTFKLISLYLGI